MRTLTATLLAKQKSGQLNPLHKVTLTRTGFTTYTYDRTRVIVIDHDEQSYSQKATVTLDNSDKSLNDIDLEGYTAVISYGQRTSAGDEYSDCAPLSVISQQFNSSQEGLDCILTMQGIPNLMMDEEASEAYKPDDADTNTVKTLITAIAGATMACFNHCPAYEVVYDSEDSLIDTFMPKDKFRIYEKGKRLAAIRTLLGFTGCAMIVKADGKIHIFVPTVSVTQGWVSPTGHTAPNWGNPAYAYDGNISTLAFRVSLLNTYTEYLQLNIAAIKCSKVRVYARNTGSTPPTTPTISIDVYYDLAWHAVYEGVFTQDAWIEYAIPEGTQHVSSARIRFNRTDGGLLCQAAVKEFQFYADYDYVYSLGRGYHTFFAKAYQNRLVIPNYVSVRSNIDDDPQYSGEATDPSYAKLLKKQFHRMTLDSDAQAVSIAAAMIVRAQLEADGGSGSVPLNAGAEALDYVQVVDARAGDSRTGNIGSISRRVNIRKNIWVMSFGFGGWVSVRGLLNELATYSDGTSFERLYAKDLYAENITTDNLDIAWIDPEGNINLSLIGDDLDNLPDGETYARVKAVHLDSGGLVIDDACVYGAGYDPSTKMAGDADMDDIPDGVTYKRIQSAALSAGGLVLADQIVVSGTYGLVKNTQLSAGEVVLSTTNFTVDKDGIRTAVSGTRLEITSAGLKGYNSTSLQFSLSATDGKAYCGGGVVVLDSSGIRTKGNYTVFADTDDAVRGYIYGDKTSDSLLLMSYEADLYLSAYYGVNDIIFAGDIIPDINNYYDFGSASYRVKGIFAYTLDATTEVKAAAFKTGAFTGVADDTIVVSDGAGGYYTIVIKAGLIVSIT